MKKIIALLSIITSIHGNSQTIMPLFDGKIPNYIPSSKVEIILKNGSINGITVPQLSIFLPQNPDSARTAIIICPGGGYSYLEMEKEGYQMAKTLNSHGIAAFVLKYRIPNDSFMTNKSMVPLQDAEKAIQLIRENASKWDINENNIGIMGFSAGGHLASTLATHFTELIIENKKDISLRPNFLVLAYPVISFDKSITHMNSRINLLGKNATEDMVNHFSNELQVTPQTPITFIVHSSNDGAVPVENTIRFYQALIRNNVPAEIHIYEKGGHGFGLHNKTTKDEWIESLIHWMMTNKIIKG